MRYRRSPFRSVSKGYEAGRRKVPGLAEMSTEAILRQLAQRRREVGQCDKSGVNFVDDLSVGFGFVANALPLRIVLKRLPVCSCRLAAGMTQDINQGIALPGLVDRRPVSDALHSM